jgi:hypothetical protein
MKKYIINPSTFPTDGEVTSFINEDNLVAYTSGLTFAQYNERAGGNLILLDGQTLQDEWLIPYLKSRETDWQEVTEGCYYKMLNVMPPARFETYGEYEIFMVGEAWSHNIHSCYIWKNGKYYNALRMMSRSSESIYRSLIEQLANNGSNQSGNRQNHLLDMAVG